MKISPLAGRAGDKVWQKTQSSEAARRQPALADGAFRPPRGETLEPLGGSECEVVEPKELKEARQERGGGDFERKRKWVFRRFGRILGEDHS